MRHNLTLKSSPHLKSGEISSNLQNFIDGEFIKISQGINRIYLTYRQSQSMKISSNTCIEVPQQFLKLNSLQNNMSCSLEKVIARKIQKIQVKVSQLDYKIICNRQLQFAQFFLDQVRIIWKNGKIPLYYNENDFVVLNIDFQEQCGCLGQNSLVQFMQLKQKQFQKEEIGQRMQRVFTLRKQINEYKANGYENQISISEIDFKQLFGNTIEKHILINISNQIPFFSCPSITQFNRFVKNKQEKLQPQSRVLICPKTHLKQRKFQCSKQCKELSKISQVIRITNAQQNICKVTILTLEIFINSPQYHIEIYSIDLNNKDIKVPQKQKQLSSKQETQEYQKIQRKINYKIIQELENNHQMFIFQEEYPYSIDGQLYIIKLVNSKNQQKPQIVKIVANKNSFRDKEKLIQKIINNNKIVVKIYLSEESLNKSKNIISENLNQFYVRIQKWIYISNLRKNNKNRLNNENPQNNISWKQQKKLKMFQVIYQKQIQKVLDFVCCEQQICERNSRCVVCSLGNNGKSFLIKVLGQKYQNVWSMDFKKINDPTYTYKDIELYLEYIFMDCPYQVIFIDNFDAICYQVESGDLHRKKEKIISKLIIRKILQLMKLFSKRCIFTAKSQSNIDQEFQSHNVITLKNPSRDLRTKALEKLNQLEKIQSQNVIHQKLNNLEIIKESASEEQSDQVQQKIGISRQLIDKIVESTQSLSFGLFSQHALLKTENIKAISKAAKNNQINNFSKLAGLQVAKQTIKSIIEKPLKYAAIYKTVPIKLPRGILLYGATGNGKSALGGSLQMEFGMRYFSIKGSDILSKYIGGSEAAVREIFEKALSVSPSIIFFDEFESIVPRRNSSGTGVNDRIVNQFLCYLDGVSSISGVFIVAASSRPDLIDPAILRPGRLDSHMFLDYPTDQEKLEIIAMYQASVRIQKLQKDIIQMTSAYSYSDMIGLFKQLRIKKSAKVLKMDKYTSQDFIKIQEELFDETVRLFKKSVDETEQKRQRQIFQSFRAGEAPSIKKQRQILQ